MFNKRFYFRAMSYTQAGRILKLFLKFMELVMETQQREAVVQGRSLSPYRLRYKKYLGLV
jgi:hypothetical protein